MSWFSIPGLVDEPATLDLSAWRGGLDSTVREAVRRRCKHGDFPITFRVRLEEGSTPGREDFSEVRDHLWGYPPPPPFKKLDFRKITRGAERVRTTISVDLGYTYREQVWIIAGSMEISQNQERGTATLKAHLPRGVTDFENDSCYAFYFDVIGLRFTLAMGGTSWFKAYLHPNPENFKVPGGDYNPMGHSDARAISDGDEPHTILPEGFYTPTTPEDGRKLFRMLQGKELTIRIGPTPLSDEEEE
jgi:hypothetical protein